MKLIAISDKPHELILHYSQKNTTWVIATFSWNCFVYYNIHYKFSCKLTLWFIIGEKNDKSSH